MTKDMIISRWNGRGYDDAESLIRWNKDAPMYGAMELPTEESSLAMRIMFREDMILPGTTGLDVGCGGGRFSLAMQRCGMQIHGTDFSPKMIEQATLHCAELHAGATFSVDNWHTVSLEEKGWAHSFDLVLAHMTPAVIDAASFLRLIEASRGWVLMLKPTRWRTPVLDELRTYLGCPQEESAMDVSFSDAFSLAWLEGYNPRTDYAPSVWQDDMTVEEAVNLYYRRLPRMEAPETETKTRIRAFLEKSFSDGQVHDETHTLTAALWLHV